jgi:hypothetical protein
MTLVVIDPSLAGHGSLFLYALDDFGLPITREIPALARRPQPLLRLAVHDEITWSR